MSSGFELKRISVGGKTYLDEQSFLDFLEKRSTLTVEKLCRQGTPLGETEYLRGQYFEQQAITNAIRKPSIS